jgi:SH3-like domain-containing protein
MSHRIDWVLKRREMPLQIVDEYGHWRKIRDHDGVGGWVHNALLTGARTVIIQDDMLQVLARPSADAQTLAIFEAGVVASLKECTLHWCQVSAGGHQGWAPKSALWGVSEGEIRQ